MRCAGLKALGFNTFIEACNVIGYGSVPKGYVLRLAADGHCALFANNQTKEEIDGQPLAAGIAANVASQQWHNLELQFTGTTISGYVDGVQVLSATNSLHSHGMAGLIAGDNKIKNTACFDNFLINAVAAPALLPTVISKKQTSIYCWSILARYPSGGCDSFTP